MPMVNLLKKEQVQHETTTIVVSHNKAFFEVADTILILNGGKISYEGNLEKAMPILADFRICNFRPCEEGKQDARCFR
jgi:Fe-S cluster assembly ATP-binding protein